MLTIVRLCSAIIKYIISCGREEIFRPRQDQDDRLARAFFKANRKAAYTDALVNVKV